MRPGSWTPKPSPGLTEHKHTEVDVSQVQHIDPNWRGHFLGRDAYISIYIYMSIQTYMFIPLYVYIYLFPFEQRTSGSLHTRDVGSGTALISTEYGIRLPDGAG